MRLFDGLVYVVGCAALYGVSFIGSNQTNNLLYVIVCILVYRVFQESKI